MYIVICLACPIQPHIVSLYSYYYNLYDGKLCFMLHQLSVVFITRY